MKLFGITVNVTVQNNEPSTHSKVTQMKLHTDPEAEEVANYAEWIEAHRHCMWLVTTERAYLAGRSDERRSQPCVKVN